MKTASRLTLFYDSRCPLCCKEMAFLSKRDERNRLTLVDLHSEKQLAAYPQINRDKAMRYLHGILNDSTTVYGLDVTYHAWRLIGKGRWMAPLRWRLIKPVADRVYRLFARHRHRIARLVTGCSSTDKHSTCSFPPDGGER